MVCIETFEYSGALYGLLKVLGDLYVQDLQNLSSEENFTRLPGGRLADRLGITEEAMRRRILKFRREVSREFRDGLGRALGKNDIIENRRDWNGYRLNPRIVRVVAWDQMPRTSPEQ